MTAQFDEIKGKEPIEQPTLMNLANGATRALITQLLIQSDPGSEQTQQFMRQNGGEVTGFFINIDRNGLELFLKQKKAVAEVSENFFEIYDRDGEYIKMMHDAHIEDARGMQALINRDMDTAGEHLKNANDRRMAADPTMTEEKARQETLNSVTKMGAEMTNQSEADFLKDYGHILGGAAANAFGPGSVLPLVTSDIYAETTMTAALAISNQELARQLFDAMRSYAKDDEEVAEAFRKKADEMKKLADEARSLEPGSLAFKEAVKKLDGMLKERIGVSIIYAVMAHSRGMKKIVPAKIKE